MSNKVAAVAIACSTVLAAAARPAPALAQSGTVIVPAGPVPRAAAERTVLPNPALLSSGMEDFTISYGPAVVAAIVSDHKGDNDLFIPVVGPWMNLGRRGCSGPTVLTSDGPFEFASGQTCGTSGLESIAIIAAGVVQGWAAAEIVAAFFVPQRRVTVVAAPASPGVSIRATSFGGLGAGAVAVRPF